MRQASTAALDKPADTTFSARLVRNAILPIWLRRDHPAYQRYLREFQQAQFRSTDEIEELQLARLKRLLAHAYSNCPFYRKRMTDASFEPDEIKSIQDLSVLPLLSKRDIQDRGQDMEALNLPNRHRARNQTGGSTGTPLQFYVDRERFDSRMASTDRHNQWAGLYQGDWRALIWGSRLDQGPSRTVTDYWKNLLLYRSILLNSSSIDEDDWPPFIDQIRSKRPRVLLAYTQGAILFAQYLQQNSIEDIHFASIITTAEVLLPGQREFLERSFSGRVFNRYGCREVSIIASECGHHTGMHVSAETLIIEILKDDPYPGGAGRVVITDLLNYSMPLIRYEIGDVAAWAENQSCPCGRHLPLITDVQGRTTEFLRLQNGRYISGPALTLVVADLSDVRQVQFVQNTPDMIEIRVVPGEGYGADTKEELRRRLGPYVGGQVGIVIRESDAIPSAASGKFRFAINNCSRTDGNS